MLIPFTSISCFWDLVKFLNFGMKCSTRSNKIWRSLEYKKQSIKKCCDDSVLKWQLHSADSDWPIENLCKFSSDLSNLILVSKVFPIFEPLEKCLYFFGLSSYTLTFQFIPPRGQTDRGFKKADPDPDICNQSFVSLKRTGIE